MSKVTVEELHDSLSSKIFEIDTINSNIEDIENSLYTLDDAFLETTHGKKSFNNNKNGYTDYIYMKGCTLNNIATIGNINGTDADGVIRTRFFSFSQVWDSYYNYRRYSGGTFTFVNYTDKTINFVGRNSSDNWAQGVSVPARSVVVKDIPEDYAVVGVDFGAEHGWSNADLSIYNSSMFAMFEGDHSDKDLLNMPNFVGIRSIGDFQGIELATFGDKQNLSLTWDTTGYISSQGVYQANPDFHTCNEYIPIEDTKNYYLNSNDTISFYNSDKVNIPYDFNVNPYIRRPIGYKGTGTANAFGLLEVHPPVGAKYMRLTVPKLRDKSQVKVWAKRDKVTLPIVLRGLPNGICDTIEKRGNHYVLIKRCEELRLNGSENFFVANSPATTETIYFVSTMHKIGEWNLGNIVCDSFSTHVTPHGYEDGIHGLWYEDREGMGQTNSDGIRIRIKKSRLASQDAAGFNAWLRANPVKIIYQLAQPEIFVLNNINLQTFEGETTFATSSNVVDGECSFYIASSISNDIEILKQKIDSINTIREYKMTAVNGWACIDNYCHIACMNNVVTINMLMDTQNAKLTYGTYIGFIPEEIAPPCNVPIFFSSNGVTIGNGFINPDGKVGIDSNCELTPNTWYSFNAAYIVHKNKF